MAKKTGKPQVTVRLANGASTMAKAKKNPKRKHAKRRNPSNPRRTHHRRRRNPRGDFSDRALKLGGAAIAAVAGGVLSYVAMSKLAQYGAVAEYGVPAVLFGTGVAVAKSHPLVGGGLALGAAAPFVAPLASKAIAAIEPPKPAPATTAGIARAARAMRAVQMRSVQMAGRIY